MRLARGQVILQISPINFFRSFRPHGELRKYESFLHRGQQNNKNALFRIVPPLSKYIINAEIRIEKY